MNIAELKSLLETHETSCASQCPALHIFKYLLENPIQQGSVDFQVHDDQHAWIQLQIDKERIKEERRQKVVDGIKQQVVGWTIITFIGSLVSGLGYWAYKIYHHLLKP
jgi:hypothetical protein